MIRTLGRGCLILIGLVLMAVVALALFMSGAFNASDRHEPEPSASAAQPRCPSTDHPHPDQAADAARSWVLASHCWDTRSDSSVAKAASRAKPAGPAQITAPAVAAEQFEAAKDNHSYSVPSVTSLEPISGDEASGQVTYQVETSWYWLGDSAAERPGGTETSQVTAARGDSGNWQITEATQIGETQA